LTLNAANIKSMLISVLEEELKKYEKKQDEVIL
jgi:hypothetical protein